MLCQHQTLASSIIKLETSGITNPTIDTLQKIAKALDVSVDDLLK